MENFKINLTARNIERYKEHLALAALGFSNKEIGKLLFSSLSTVKKTFNTIFEKMKVKDRTSAVSKGWASGILNSFYMQEIIEKYGIKQPKHEDFKE